MQQKHPNVTHQVAPKQHNLAVQHELQTRATRRDRGPEPGPVDNAKRQRGEEDRENLERLRELQPHERHERGNRVIKELEENQLTTS